jgi:3-oxoacid CoA-transferase subunit B
LPYTGRGVVHRIITDLAGIDVRPDNAGLQLVELAPGVTIDTDRAAIQANLRIAV